MKMSGVKYTHSEHITAITDDVKAQLIERLAPFYAECVGYLNTLSFGALMDLADAQSIKAGKAIVL